MKIMVFDDKKKRRRTYSLAEHFDGSKPLRELVIQSLAKCRFKRPFCLVFEKEEVIKIKQILFYFFQEPFSRYGEIGTINDFFEFFLLADFKASSAALAFSVCPLVKGKGKDIKIIADLVLHCDNWEHMIHHAKYILASRPNATKKDKNAFNRHCLKA